MRRVAIGTFGAMGLAVALTALTQTAHSGACTSTVGNLMELDAIAACVVGRTSLHGGGHSAQRPIWCADDGQPFERNDPDGGLSRSEIRRARIGSRACRLARRTTRRQIVFLPGAISCSPTQVVRHSPTPSLTFAVGPAESLPWGCL